MNLKENRFLKPNISNINGASRLLRAAKKRIGTKETWTKKELFRDKNNKPLISYQSEKACKFCALGALEVESEDFRNWPSHIIALHYLALAANTLYLSSGIAAINDRLGFDAVHNVFQVAIDMAEEDWADLFSAQQAVVNSHAFDAGSIGYLDAILSQAQTNMGGRHLGS